MRSSHWDCTIAQVNDAWLYRRANAEVAVCSKCRSTSSKSQEHGDAIRSSRRWRELHWLTVRQRITFKVTVDEGLLVTGSLRSAGSRARSVSRTHNHFGDRSISAFGPHLWNTLYLMTFDKRKWAMNTSSGSWQLEITMQCDLLIICAFKYSYLLTYIFTHSLTHSLTHLLTYMDNLFHLLI